MRRVLTLLTLAAVTACGDGGQHASPVVPSSLTVTSTAFSDGAAIPDRFTCHGAGTFPPLAWTGVPSGARSLALVVDDPDAPSGTYTHWVVFDLDPTARHLEAGSAPAGARQARNSAGRTGWTPPCPPSGTHTYRFTVYALERSLDLPAGTATNDVLRAIGAAATAQGRLTGTARAG